MLKLVVWPALFLPLAVHYGLTGEKLVAILIMLGSPPAVSCYIMAKNMNHEGSLTSSVVVATTFFKFRYPDGVLVHFAKLAVDLVI